MKSALALVITLAFALPAAAGEPTRANDKKPAAATTEAYEDEKDHFVADSFSFGVEREMKESGEKGGTEDINIGVGELQEADSAPKAVKTRPKR